MATTDAVAPSATPSRIAPPLLACPDDTGHPFHIAHRDFPAGVIRIERHQLNDFAVCRSSSLAITSPSTSLHDNPVATAHAGAWLDNQHVAVAIERQHGIALNLQRIRPVIRARRHLHQVPALPGRKPGIVEKTSGAGLGEAKQRD